MSVCLNPAFGRYSLDGGKHGTVRPCQIKASLQIWTRSESDHTDLAPRLSETVACGHCRFSAGPYAESHERREVARGGATDEPGCSPAGKGSQIVLVARYFHDRIADLISQLVLSSASYPSLAQASYPCGQKLHDSSDSTA